MQELVLLGFKFNATNVNLSLSSWFTRILETQTFYNILRFSLLSIVYSPYLMFQKTVTKKNNRHVGDKYNKNILKT